MNQHVMNAVAGAPVDLRSASSRATILSELDVMQTATGGQVPQTAVAAAYAGETWIVVQTDGATDPMVVNGRGLHCASSAGTASEDPTTACDNVASITPNGTDHIAVYEVLDAGTWSIGASFVVTAFESSVSLDSQTVSVVGQAHDLHLSVVGGKTTLQPGAPSCNAGDSTSDLRRAVAVGAYTDINFTALVGYQPSFSSSDASILSVATSTSTAMVQSMATAHST